MAGLSGSEIIVSVRRDPIATCVRLFYLADTTRGALLHNLADEPRCGFAAKAGGALGDKSFRFLGAVGGGKFVPFAENGPVLGQAAELPLSRGPAGEPMPLPLRILQVELG